MENFFISLIFLAFFFCCLFFNRVIVNSIRSKALGLQTILDHFHLEQSFSYFLTYSSLNVICFCKVLFYPYPAAFCVSWAVGWTFYVAFMYTVLHVIITSIVRYIHIYHANVLHDSAFGDEAILRASRTTNAFFCLCQVLTLNYLGAKTSIEIYLNEEEDPPNSRYMFYMVMAVLILTILVTVVLRSLMYYENMKEDAVPRWDKKNLVKIILIIFVMFCGIMFIYKIIPKHPIIPRLIISATFSFLLPILFVLAHQSQRKQMKIHLKAFVEAFFRRSNRIAPRKIEGNEDHIK